MFNALKEKLANETVQKSLGIISELAKKHLGPKLNEIVNDEKKMAEALSLIYAQLPQTVTAVCPQQTFVTLCLKHKDVIFKKATAA